MSHFFCRLFSLIYQRKTIHLWCKEQLSTASSSNQEERNMSIHIPEEQDPAWHVTLPMWTCSIPTHRKGTSRSQCSFDKNSLQDSWCGLVIPPLTALLLAWQKHLFAFSCLIIDSCRKIHRNSSFTSKERKQPGVIICLFPETNPVYQAIAAKLMYHIGRELANNFINNNQQKDS